MIKWTKKDFVSLIWIVISATIIALNLNSFVYSGKFYPGGFSGISLLLIHVLKDYLSISISFGFMYALLNIPAAFLVYKKVGKKFTIFSIIHFGLVSLITLFLPDFYLAYDLMLLSIFGGIIAGVATLIALSRNASGGGSDFIAIWLSDKLKRSVWSWMMGINIVIVLMAGYIYGLEIALYSIIYQFVYTQILNDRYTRYKSKALYIITTHPDEVSANIIAHTRHGITKIWGEGAYTKKQRALLYIVVQAYQVNQVVMNARKVDPDVFISISNTERVIGNYYQTPLE